MKLIDKKLADLKAAQENGTYTLCPRCGCDTMRPKLYTNALSRIADIQVCSECGVTESKLAFMQAPDSLYGWVALQPVRPESDFAARPAEEVWKLICEQQATKLSRIYERFEADEDVHEIRMFAFENCPGLTQFWTHPFQMKYKAADGYVLVQFKRTETGLEMTASLTEA